MGNTLNTKYTNIAELGFNVSLEALTERVTLQNLTMCMKNVMLSSL